jgi:hypothetical protein
MRSSRPRIGVAAVLSVVLIGLLVCAVAAQDKEKAPAPTPAPAQEQEYEKLAPFEAVRWTDGDGVEVDLGGIKYTVLELQDFPVKEVLDYCRKHHGKDWRKAFEESLVEVLTKMGKPPEAYTLKVKFKRVEDGEERTFERVMLSEYNLEMTVKNRQVVAEPGPDGEVKPVNDGEKREPAGRVEREHSGEVAEKFKFLAERIEPRTPEGRRVLPPADAEEDLDELEWHLVNRYSYLTLKGVEYQAALDTIRAGLGDGIPRAAFAFQIHRFLTLFGDGHTDASFDEAAELPGGYLPFRVGEIEGGKLVAFEVGPAGPSGFVDLDHPVLSKLDGVEVEKWLEAAKAIAPGGSPQFVRRGAAESLVYANFLRGRLGIPIGRALRVELQSVDGKRTSAIDLQLADEPPRPLMPREGLRRTLGGNVGYLRIATMSDDAGFAARVHEAMADLRGTKALVIDVRGNGGGSRLVLRELFPYFMKPDDAPRIANVAAFRLPEDRRPDERMAAEGFLQDRFLYPVTSSVWTEQERAAIEKLAKDFKPEWQPPEGQFSAWHYLLLSPKQGGLYYHYDKPVAVLMDGGCFSATDVFLGAFKGWRNVTLIGTPSGGGSGRAQNVTLANSRTRLRLSSMASFQPNGKLYDGRGVVPDVVAHPAPDDYVSSDDAMLDLAVKKLSGN